MFLASLAKRSKHFSQKLSYGCSSLSTKERLASQRNVISRSMFYPMSYNSGMLPCKDPSMNVCCFFTFNSSLMGAICPNDFIVCTTHKVSMLCIIRNV